MKNPFSNIDGIKVIMEEGLAKHTTFNIGGAAHYFVYVYSKKALKEVLKTVMHRHLRYFIIGAGTNLLVSDQGFRGVVLKLGGTLKRMTLRNGLCRCGGGMLIKDFLDRTMKKGYGGAEFLAGIPGTLGGAIKGNAGAFGNSISDITEKVFLMNQYGVEETRTKTEVGFSYRNSHIKKWEFVTAVQLILKKQNRKSILRRLNRNLKSRQRKHPKGFSAGSFFKNPPGRAAGKLIEDCGFKGRSVGDAMVSEKHGNYIINRGNARAADVLALAGQIKEKVRAKTGISLQREVILLR
jgi:UDP-N-acetylmuramate dehydrogenase